MGRSENAIKRKILLLVSLLSNLGLLGYFKYGNFLLENFSAWCATIGFNFHPLATNIILPIGISFYTFASLSYTVDVYRKEIRSDWKFTDYALFVSFFPHLVAGPIVRASQLLPQIEHPQLPTKNEIGRGFMLVFFGLFSKVVMADALFAPLVDQAYQPLARPALLDAWIAVLSFSGQIYYDFSGYSLCAIGLAMVFGFRFPDNFRGPYGAVSFTDFWRRWHISLSTWLRDYLYIPLGGNRNGRFRTYLAIFMTMLIGGLWHGASWMFVLWGGLHGAYLVMEKVAQHFATPKPVFRIGKSCFIFLIVTLTWIPFRSSSPHQAFEIIRGLINVDELGQVDLPKILAVLIMGLTVRWHILMKGMRFDFVVQKNSATVAVVSGVLAMVSLFLFSSGNSNAFIYFQF